jgi:hypothetical protein
VADVQWEFLGLELFEDELPRGKGSTPAVVLYLAVLCAALFAIIAQQVGWRPPFIRVWDGRAAIYFMFVCGFVAFVAGAALGALLRSEKLPPRIRDMPVWMGLLLPGFIMMGGLSLSPASSTGEISAQLFMKMLFGLGLAAFGTLISSLSGKGDRDPPTARDLNVLATVLIVGSLAIAAILLLPLRQVDNGKLQTVAEFGGPDLTLALIFDEPPVVDMKLGMLKVLKGEVGYTMVLEKDEWARLIDLWSKAKAATANQRRTIGEIRESDVSEPTRLRVDAGPGIRFTFSSEHGGPLVFELPPSDLQRFDAALGQIGGKLTQ